MENTTTPTVKEVKEWLKALGLSTNGSRAERYVSHARFCAECNVIDPFERWLEYDLKRYPARKGPSFARIWASIQGEMFTDET